MTFIKDTSIVKVGTGNGVYLTKKEMKFAGFKEGQAVRIYIKTKKEVKENENEKEQ